MNNTIENFKEISSLPYVTIKYHKLGRLRICVEMAKGRGSYF